MTTAFDWPNFTSITDRIAGELCEFFEVDQLIEVDC